MQRWNLTILLIVCAAVFGFMAGYVYRDRFTNWYQKDQIAEQQPDISGQILNASIQEILQPETSNDAVTQPAEVYSFTGYIRSISADTITVERPDDTTEGADAIDFILTESTSYTAIRTESDAIGVITKIDEPLSRYDLTIGDIVAVYSIEDIASASERHLTKVERITTAPDSIN